MLSKFSSKPNFIQVNKVNRTFIQISFFIKHNRKDILSKILAKRMVCNYNKNIDSIKKFKSKIRDLYLLYYSPTSINIGTYDVMSFYLVIPKIGIIDEFELENVFKFFHDNIYNPLACDGHFNTKQFDFEKEYLLKKIEDYPSSINEYVSDKFFDFYDEDRNDGLHIDEYIDYLDKIDSKSCFNYYLNNIINNPKRITYIYGNLDNKKELLKHYNKYFNDNNIFKIHNVYFKKNKLLDYKYTEEITKYNQSVLNQYYQIINRKNEDEHLLVMLYYFLYSKENNLLFNNIRVKNNLIYNLYVSYDNRLSCLEIRVFFNIEDKKTIKNIISKVFNNIKIEKNFNIYKEKLITALKYDVFSEEDDYFHEAINKINKEICHFTSIEDRIEICKKIKYDDMVNFINRVILTREMIMIAGEKNE